MQLDNINLLISIVKKAGDIILRHYKHNVNIEYKSDNSPVTIADKEANQFIIEQLKIYFPSIPIVTEEEDIHLLYEDPELFWLVDPLDGTRAFIKNDQNFTVNIALIKNNSAFLGIIYHPVTEEIFCNLDGENSIKLDNQGNEIKLQGSDLSKNRIIIGCSSSTSEEQLKDFLAERRAQSEVEIITKASSIKFCCLALGEADIYPRFGETMEWDTAAGHAILKGAGGEIFDLQGKELKYNKSAFTNKGFIAFSNKLKSKVIN